MIGTEIPELLRLTPPLPVFIYTFNSSEFYKYTNYLEQLVGMGVLEFYRNPSSTSSLRNLSITSSRSYQ